MRRLQYTAGVLAILLFAALMTAGCAKSMRATTMRLERAEGSVRLSNQDGKERTLKEDLRFQNGDVLGTGKESFAGVSLDDTKAALLDADSRAEFYQDEGGDWIEINLVEGDLFFNVKEKLREKEEFEIHTSTMVLGIRGTSGYVTAAESGEDTLIVTDGTVRVRAEEQDSAHALETDVSAGHRLRVIPADIAPSGHIEMEVREISPEDLPALALRAISEDEDLLERVCGGTGWEAWQILTAAGEEVPVPEESAEPQSEEEKAMILGENAAELVEEAFPPVKVVNNSALVRSVVSRKKQVVPALISAMNRNADLL